MQVGLESNTPVAPLYSLQVRTSRGPNDLDLLRINRLPPVWAISLCGQRMDTSPASKIQICPFRAGRATNPP